MEVNDIQEIDIEEMTLTDIEKMIADNDKKILSNLSKIQKLVENCNSQIQTLTAENAKLKTESKVLNQQKFQKLFDETKARMLEQFEQAKMLSVENLLTPAKAKSQKKDKTPKKLSSPEVKVSESVEIISDSADEQKE